MALLDRVKERIETDLSDAELQLMIDEVAAEIDRRFGPVSPVTIYTDGARKFVTLWRPMDTGQAVTVTEIEAKGVNEAGNSVDLAADDYRVLDGGRTLERLTDGTNGRSLWAAVVKVVYTPVSNQAARDGVTINVVALDLTYRGLDKQERAGDYQRAGALTPDAYTKERDALLDQLAPRTGLGMA